jgi:hypothetical protein
MDYCILNYWSKNYINKRTVHLDGFFYLCIFIYIKQIIKRYGIKI